ncbi:RidA family protein [Planococcus sp. YIM B11945]|uniref:RidA family protein n=1 Tax=Planococcus sp. YIM B11945 TaxID=3435410 RepID=UPI003D7C76C2
METKKIKRTNPAGVPAPVGNYTHITKIPRNAELYVMSGQIGVDAHGDLPGNFNQQIANTFSNIKNVLASEQLSSENIIKVNVWATEKIDWDFMYTEWSGLFGDEYPAMTVGYLVELGWPEIKIEIEIWAAKA